MIKSVGDEEGTYLLSTGDPMIAGLGKFFSNSQIEPGISSIQRCASLIHEPLIDSVLLSTRYGKNYDKIKLALEIGLGVFILPEPNLNVGQTARKLMSYIGSTVEMSVCLDLTLESQRIYRGSIMDLMNIDDNGLKVIFIKPPHI